MSKAQSVYIMEADGRFKIGISVNPEQRAKQLRVVLPGIRLLFSSGSVGNASEIESRVHKVLQEFSCGGEWYSGISEEELERIISETVELYRADGKQESQIAKNIRRILGEQGLKQGVAAKRCGLTDAQFSDLLAGRKMLRAGFVPILADALGVEIGALFDGCIQRSSSDITRAH